MSHQLLQILPSRRTNNQVWLIFKEKIRIPFFVDDVVNLHLKSYQEIDAELWQKIQETSLYYLLYNYTLRQIALSPKIASILIPKIRQKLYIYLKKYHLSGDFSFLIDQVIAKVESQNLLDESSFAKYLLRKNSHRSRQYLSLLFSHYHLDFPEDFSNCDIENIKSILIKKNILSQNLLESSAKNKIFSSLSRKGFAYNDIKTAIDELGKNR